MKTYKFRAYPSDNLQQKIDEQIEICRFLYNTLLSEINKARKEGREIKRADTQALIVELKKENTELKNVYSKVLQMVNFQLWSNIKVLSSLKKKGKKVGKLRFKKKGRWKSMNFNQSGFSLDIKNNSISFSKIGEIPVKFHRKPEGKIKAVILKKYPSGKYYIHVITETEDDIEPTSTNRAVGIDVGINNFLVDSDGHVVENPKNMDKTLYKIKKLHRDLSRKKKGSNNRRKAKIKLATAYETLENQRRDFLHKLSRYYVNNYDAIAVENLNIKGMIKGKHRNTLHRHMADASWGEFVNILTYKVEETGKSVIKVPPQYTSMTCARCGHRVEKLSLSQRTFVCPSCGWTADRDYNASVNILKSGLGQPEEPVESEPLLQNISYTDIVSGQVLLMNQEAPCVSEG